MYYVRYRLYTIKFYIHKQDMNYSMIQGIYIWLLISFLINSLFQIINDAPFPYRGYIIILITKMEFQTRFDGLP